MKLIYTFIIFTFIHNIITAQEPVVISRLANTSITEQDNIVVISTLGESLAGVTEENGVVVTTEPVPFLLMGQTTSLRDLPLIDGLKAYPNPTTAIAILERIQADDNFKISIYRADGVILKEKIWNAGETAIEISLENYAQGIYILSVSDENETKASQFKMLKQ